MRLFHSATIFFAAIYVFVVWNFTWLITRLNNFYFFYFLCVCTVCVCGGGGGGG